MRQKQPTWISDPSGQGRFEAWVSINKKVADVRDRVTGKIHSAMSKKQVAKLRMMLLELLNRDVQEFADMDQDAIKEFIGLLEYLLLDAMVE